MDEKDFLDELEQDMEYDPFTVMCGAVKFNDAHLFADAYTRFVKNQTPKNNKKKSACRRGCSNRKNNGAKSKKIQKAKKRNTNGYKIN